MSWRWWEQNGQYLEGAKKREANESDKEEVIGEKEGMTLKTTTGKE